MRDILSQVYRYSTLLIIPVFVWAFIALGMWLRITNADKYPVSQNDDGLFYVWTGNSILDNFWHPTSLTIFEKENPQLIWRSQYKNTNPIEAFGYRISDPWFDHPPLATILIALPARLLGYRDFNQIPHMVVRASALFASLFTLLMTYVLARDVFNKYVGLISLVILSLWPLAAFSERQSYLENIMTPFWLLSLWLTWKQRKKTAHPRLLVVLIMSNFVLAWSKIIGYLGIGISIFFTWKYNRKTSLIVLVGGICTGLLYLVYGQLVGGSYFWHNLLNQGERGAYVTSIFHILNNPEIYGLIEDGWWYLGWFGLLYIAGSKTKERTFISLSALFWMIALFMLAGPQSNSPWYRYPIYPLLSISIGVILADGWNRLSLIPEIILLLLGGTGYALAGITIPSPLLRLIIMAYVGILAANALFIPKKQQLWIQRCLVGVGLIVTLYGNVLAIQQFPDRICKDRGCVIPEKIEAR